MRHFTLRTDETVLHESTVTADGGRDNLLLTLTSRKILLEKRKGFFKKDRVCIHSIDLHSIKIYYETPQIKQNGATVEIQSANSNLTLTFSNAMEARKFAHKTIDAVIRTRNDPS